jgi:apolipoprotein N-acyltransferase
VSPDSVEGVRGPGRWGSGFGALPLAGIAGGLVGLLLLPPVQGGAGRLGVGILALAGLAFAAGALLRSRDRLEAARAGFLVAGISSLLALHWVPAAMAPWWGSGAGLLAGITLWSLHGVVGSLAYLAMAGLAHRVPTLLRFAAGWLVVERFPALLPLLPLPRPEMAALLVDAPGLAGSVPLLGGSVVVALWAGVVAVGVEAFRGGDPGAPRSGGGSRGRGSLAPVGAGLVAVVLLLLPLVERGLDSAADPGSEEVLRLVVAELPLEREALVDAHLRRERVEAGVEAVGAAHLWPEALLAEVDRIPEGLREPDGPPETGAWIGVHREEEGRRYNAVVHRSAGGILETVHRKHRLVPGVERTRIRRPGLPGRGLAPGPPPEPFPVGPRMGGALICFEVLFPALVGRLRKEGATLLLHLGNDTMLQPGGSLPNLRDSARRQQDGLLGLRALETRMPIVRSAMGGRSGGWDRRGRPLPVEVGAPGLDGAGPRTLEIRVPEAGAIPPAAHLGDLPVWIAALLLGAGLVGRRRMGGPDGPGEAVGPGR